MLSKLSISGQSKILSICFITLTSSVLFVQKGDTIIYPGVGIGVISIADTEKKLVEKFGQQNIVSHIEYYDYGEPADQYSTTVFPGTEEEIKLNWTDSSRTRIWSVSLYYNGLPSRWTLPEGIRVGTTLEELEKISGSEVRFEGLNPIETAGSVIFDASKLKKYHGIVFMRLDRLGNSSCKESLDLNEDKIYSSHQVRCKKNIVIFSLDILF